MRCLETRTTAAGWTRRRYETTDGRRITTLELPASVVSAVGRGRLLAAMQAWQRGEDTRARAAAVRAIIASHPGMPLRPLAKLAGVSTARVSQVRRELDRERAGAAQCSDGQEPRDHPGPTPRPAGRRPAP